MKTDNHSENLSGLSREEITAYLKGDLSAEEMHRVESILEGDDFAYEAMEGLEETKQVEELMEKLSESYHTQYTTPWYKSLAWKNIFYPVGGLLIIGAYFLFQSPENEIKFTYNATPQNNISLESKTIPTDKLIDKPKEIQKSNTTDNTAITEIDKRITKEASSVTDANTSIAMTDNKKIPTKKIKKDNPETILNKKTRNITIAFINEIRYEKLVFADNKAPIKTISRLDAPYDIFSVAGLDVVNLFYHNIFHNPDELSEGLDASFAHTDEYNATLDSEDNQKDYTYGSYIESALELYKTKKYKESIASLKIILDQYPKDVNAEFYIGLAYYRQNKSEKAIEYLDLAQNNAIAYFHDDAKLYKALSYKKKGNLKTCKKLLQEIIDNEGKNKKTALEILNHL